LRNISLPRTTELRTPSSSSAVLPSPKVFIQQQATSEEEEEDSSMIFDLEPKVIKEPIKQTSIYTGTNIAITAQSKSFISILEVLSSYQNN